MFYNKLDDLTIENMITKIKEYEYVSFDLFDTLIKRDSGSPKFVFEIIERIIADNNDINRIIGQFGSERVEAEINCRKNSLFEEITLDEIYMELNKKYDSELCRIYKNKELDIEFELCQLNPKIKNIYEWCIANGKKIIFTSDMYLPKECIQKILLKIGCNNYFKIFLSSEVRKTKSTGSLYNYLIEDLGISFKDIIHIGDNLISDYLRPKLKGIESIHITTDDKTNIIDMPVQFLKKKEYYDDYNSLKAFTSNHCRRESGNLYYQLGYETLGPVLKGFSDWLNFEFKRDNIHKVFFLARDGKILEDAYKLNCGYEAFGSYYMFASRRALIVPTLWMYDTLGEMVSAIALPRYGSIESLLRRFGVERVSYIRQAAECGIDVKQEHLYEELMLDKSFLKFFEMVKPFIYNNSKDEYFACVKYLKKIGFSGSIAIVDIGWFGNMQKALLKICKAAGIDAEITGYYLGINYSAKKSGNDIFMKGYLFDKGINEEYCELESIFNSIFEFFLSTNHGSTEKFILLGEDVKVRLRKYEYIDDKDEFTKEHFQIRQIQDGALSFMRDIITHKTYYIHWNPDVVFQNLLLFGLTPSAKLVRLFDKTKILDGKIQYLVKHRNIIQYLFNPFAFYDDLRNSLWRIGFLKSVFRVSLPYFKIYNLIRNILYQRKK